jgi:hypothetical protein
MIVASFMGFSVIFLKVFRKIPTISVTVGGLQAETQILDLQERKALQSFFFYFKIKGKFLPPPNYVINALKAYGGVEVQLRHS